MPSYTVFLLYCFVSCAFRNSFALDVNELLAERQKLLDEEDKRKPLSDQKIADLLNKQGLNMARRTVTKYREGMGILSTTLRRQYQA